ncbi:MAG: hypothetical protein ACRD18_01630, partial [Terriglobia bacterium]
GDPPVAAAGDSENEERATARPNLEKNRPCPSVLLIEFSGRCFAEFTLSEDEGLSMTCQVVAARELR